MERRNITEGNSITATDNGIDHESNRWRSPIIRDENDDAVGAALFLTAGDLTELGINPESTEEILYRIDDREAIRVIENDLG